MKDETRTGTLLDWMTRQFPRGKKQTFKQMIAAGRVLVNDEPARRLTQPINANDTVRILPRSAAASARAELHDLHPLKLIHEDEDMLVIDKPAGLLTSTVAREKRPTALAIVRRYVRERQPNARVGLIHRLDRDASGLLVFSKSHLAYESLKTQFFKHTVERIYEAIVHGRPNPTKGTIESYLIERADGSVRSTDQHGKGQRAITEYEVIGGDRRRAVVRVRLLTGRKHQIRVHLSERGCPIVGDRVYGTLGDDEPLRLRAVRLTLQHPRTGRKMTFGGKPD